MGGSVTVPGRSLVVAGPATITAHTVAAAAPVGVHSFHDTTDPGKAGLHNCVWPYDSINPSGHHDYTNTATAVGVTVKTGLVVHTREPGGSFNVTWA